jgi:hypothetical protein
MDLFKTSVLLILSHKYHERNQNQYELIFWRDSERDIISPLFSSNEKLMNWLNNGGREFIKSNDDYFCLKPEWKIIFQDLIKMNKDESSFIENILGYFSIIGKTSFHLDIEAGEISAPDEKRFYLKK